MVRIPHKANIRPNKNMSYYVFITRTYSRNNNALQCLKNLETLRFCVLYMSTNKVLEKYL
jgi:hypothetical protein